MRPREIAVEHVLRSQERLRKRLDDVPSEVRQRVAAAVREYAQCMMPIDVDRSLGLEDVVAIIDAPPSKRESAPPMAPSPPDDEGDEALLQRRGKISRHSW